MPPRPWLYLDLPITGYDRALALQERIVAARIRDWFASDVLIFVEHRPVFTLGKRGGRHHLLVTDSFLDNKNISVIHTERGGSITYHGPGQLVAYPVISLKENGLSVASYVELLEEVMLKTAADFGVLAKRDRKNHGIWKGTDKIGSLGIRVKRSIAMHGLALNVCPDLTPFSWMNPCGLQTVGVTSLAAETKEVVQMPEVRQRMFDWFTSLFGIELQQVYMEELEDLLKEQHKKDYGKIAKDCKTGLVETATAHGG